MTAPGGPGGPVDPAQSPSWTVHSPYGGPPAPPPPPPLQRRRGRRPWMVVVACLVVLAMVLTAAAALISTMEDPDERSRSAVSRFLDRVEQSESVMKLFQSGMDQAGPGDDQSTIARTASRSLERERGRVADFELGDGDSALERAREDYLGHVDAWLTAMESVARGDGIENGPQIDRTFHDACDSMRDAARAEGSNRDLARIVQICAPPESTADDGSGTLQV